MPSGELYLVIVQGNKNCETSNEYADSGESWQVELQGRNKTHVQAGYGSETADAFLGRSRLRKVRGVAHQVELLGGAEVLGIPSHSRDSHIQLRKVQLDVMFAYLQLDARGAVPGRARCLN
ncbi:hypothetical protein HUT18_20385 [Streptomyces sp. NA04227]|uniref:hypothetical protein n=1 Tax=Streptomyces sp. NA04227 TaxID=2742136 RepID=UPI00159198CB|nr:hypothetical protein [Streptomyces sp. NA04227]QKW08378.1 hypothetical protein HUT18_20385 [Streptomyces sp. NA04227]